MKTRKSLFRLTIIVIVNCFFLNLKTVQAQLPCYMDVMYDGYAYPVMRIGGNCWMRENLRTTIYADGTSIPLVRVYNDNDGNLTTYGRLYNWYSATRTSAALPLTILPEPCQGICPNGWHLPTATEWQSLAALAIDTLLSPDGWLNNVGHSSVDGFNLLPGGFYNALTHRDERMFATGYYWTASLELSLPVCANVVCNCPQLSTGVGYENNAYSVRCVRDAILPYVVTSSITDITFHSARSGGSVYHDGDAPLIARGICYSTKPNPVVDAESAILADSFQLVGDFSSQIYG